MPRWLVLFAAVSVTIVLVAFYAAYSHDVAQYEEPKKLQQVDVTLATGPPRRADGDAEAAHSTGQLPHDAQAALKQALESVAGRQKSPTAAPRNSDSDAAATHAASPRVPSVFDAFKAEKDIDGKSVDLSKYADHVVLVVNVASHCGFTRQNYDELPHIQAQYDAQHAKFTVLAFPCNQFGHQEADPPAKIAHFARVEKGATFPVMGKIDVNGAGTHRLYALLKAAAGMGQEPVEWNFAKFLVVPGAAGRPETVRYFKHDAPFAAVKAAIDEAVHATRP